MRASSRRSSNAEPQGIRAIVAAANLRLESVRESTGPSLDIARPLAQPSNLTLWYSRAATRWDEALPVGTGRLGVMICGDVPRERLQVNDDTLWSGGPARWDAPGAREALLEIRRLTLAGHFTEADRLSRRVMGPYTQSYLVVSRWTADE
jgi:hypothetical protein